MINLIDFGAAREYKKKFVDDYLRMVSSACIVSEFLDIIQVTGCKSALDDPYLWLSRFLLASLHVW